MSTKILKNLKFNYKQINLYRNLSNSGRLNKLAYYQRVGEKPLTYENIGQQFEQSVEKYAKRIAVISSYDQRQLTFEELYDEASVMAVKLKELGLKQGQHLGIWAPNTVLWPITYLGGFPLACINPALLKLELQYALKKSKTKTIITMDSYGKINFSNILDQVVDNSYAVIMKSQEKVGSHLNYDEWMKNNPTIDCISKLRSEINTIQPESPFLIQFTSGTTSKPKCAMISHFNMVNQALAMGKAITLDQGSKTICLNVPLFHAFGLAVMAASFKYGSTLCLPSPTFNAKASLEAIERDKCNILVGTPTMYVDLVEQQTKLQKDTSSMERALFGGSACTPEIVNRMKQTFLNTEIAVGYGLSEATAAVSSTDKSASPDDILQSCGRIFQHGEVKICDENGKTVEFGQVGELCVRGWCTMLGYFEDEESTKKTIDVNGWLKTGDQFILEPNGILRYQGRRKDLVIRGGENIFPKEIEDVIDKHPSVLESQVTGVPDERLGEEVCAFIRLKSEAQPLTADDIRQFCKGQLAYFKIPRYVRFVKEFPKTASGKIQKFKLQDLFQSQSE